MLAKTVALHTPSKFVLPARTQVRRRLHVAIGCIALPDAASIALHEKMGMTQVAHFKEVGYKFGRWIDIGYWQCAL